MIHTHGTHAGYQRGCRCDDCKAGNRAYHQDLRRRKAAEVFVTTRRSRTKPEIERQLHGLVFRQWVETAHARFMVEQAPLRDEELAHLSRFGVIRA